MYKLAPSILAADFSRLGEALSVLESSGAHYVHIDVMDGHFVPNITIGPPVIKSLRKASGLVFDVHLMIEEPEKYAEAFAAAGADIICFHIEAVQNPISLIQKLRALGVKPAVALKPETDARAVLPYAAELSMILCMSVNPGFGGQNFMPEALKKARALRDFIKKNNLPCDIEMDGGINIENLNTVLDSGVNVVVAGTDILAAQNVPAKIKQYLDTMETWKRRQPDLNR